MGWIGGLLAAGFLLVTTFAYAAENAGCLECNVTIWELRLMPQNVTVSFADMFEKAECEALKAEIQEQLKPFTELVCIEVWAQREKI